MNPSELVQEHYTITGMPVRVEEALRQAGFEAGQIEWSVLAPLDQFHVRGLAATEELAQGLGLAGGESVLDVGSGLGGPARYLAAVHGCHVTGIELTPTYVEVAEMLSRRAGVADRTRFVQGDALEMPFPPESFDHAWTQHVAMNVPDKVGLYRGIHRVLKPGGRLAIYDAVAGENVPVIYPVPWASEAGISFLASPTEMREALQAAGFREVSATDMTERARAWFGEMQRAPQAPGPLSLASVAGPSIGPAVANFGRNVLEGRVRLVQVIVEKEQNGKHNAVREDLSQERRD